MADTVFTVTDAWSATNRYTAVADVDVLISATRGPVTFAMTADDTAPTIAAALGHPISAGKSFPLQLKTGDRLWLAKSTGKGKATLGVLTA